MALHMLSIKRKCTFSLITLRRPTMTFPKTLTHIAGGALLCLGMISNAHAIDTLVQYSTTGAGTGLDGSYDITDINEFDWQSSGDLVISNVTSGGGGFTDFQTFVSSTVTSLLGTPISGNTFLDTSVAYDIHAHARLNDILPNAGGSIAPATLDTDGAANGDQGFEITAAISGHETATFRLTITDNGNGVFDLLDTFSQSLTFLSISGDFKWFHDDTPDSIVDSGVGFIDGTPFVTGTLSSVIGTVVVNANGVFSGNVLLSNTVSSYDTDYIQTDPDSNAPLAGTTFDTLVSLRSSGEAAAHDSGDTIGLDPYTVGTDLGLKADANSEFTANPAVPEPQAMLLLSLGLIGFGFSKKKLIS